MKVKWRLAWNRLWTNVSKWWRRNRSAWEKKSGWYEVRNNFVTTLGESKLKWDRTEAEGRGCMLRETTLWPVVCWVNSSSQLGHLSGWRGRDVADSTTHSWRALEHVAQTSICCCRRCSVLQNTHKCSEQELVCVRVAFPPPTAQPQVILSFGKKLQIPGFSSQEQIIYTHFPKEQIQKIYLQLKEDTVYHNTVN